MPILRIEHPVPHFNAWKKAFDNDPVDRKGSGVRRYRVLRAADDPNYVMIDLEFDNSSQAEAVHASLRELWGRVQAEGLIGTPKARIVETVESKEL
ncbi:MAG TPA: hypothetical protein VIP09_14335 [Dehalococcoidia bacterium]|jgi:hypothetical protein